MEGRPGVIDDPELPAVGITPLEGGRVRWCVWAPRARRVVLVLGGGDDRHDLTMEPRERGYHECETSRPARGTRYAYSLDGGPPLPDPYSRWQPEGIHAPSAVWWPGDFTWSEGGWKGCERRDLVFYELHVGTFTSEGTFDAASARIGELRELGITAIELMPVGQFPGTRSWGYDGVFPFAPQASYGGPDGLQRFVDACHRQRVAVFLDVIYNHFGPEGNVFPQFGDYLTEKYRTDWGHALNFDARGCDSVRAMVLDNARQWIRDFHLDGLRLDAADQIYDRSPRPILAEIAECAHAEAAKQGRRVHLFAETDLNDAPRFLHSPDRGGYGLDGHWNDDFHHAVHVTLTGETNGYYVDFAAGPLALMKVLEKVFVNDGVFSPFRGRRHGAPASEFAGDRFVAFTQNHDQVGNRLKSDRNAAILSRSATRLAAGLLLLTPRLPLLFMGEEYGETRPFPFFCDFQDPELVKAVRAGRKAEFAHFGWEEEVPDPVAASTRDSAVLSWRWDEPFRAGLRRLYRDLLRLRREIPALRDSSAPPVRLLTCDGDETSVLEVCRGAKAPQPVREVRIYFNLGGEECPCPPLRNVGPPSFRSEDPAYSGHFSEREPPRGVLRPHEFVILGAL